MESTFNSHIKNSDIGKTKLNKLKTIDLQIFFNDKSNHLSYSSVKKIYEILNPCIKHAVLVGDMNSNPMEGVKMPNKKMMPIQTKTIEIYTDEEVEKLEYGIFHYFEENKRLFRYAPIFIFILNTGLRAGEVLALKWSTDIDFEGRKVVVNKSVSDVKNRDRFECDTKKVSIITYTKTEKSNRIVNLNNKAIIALKEVKRRSEEMGIYSDYVVSNYNDSYILLRSFEQTFERIEKACGVSHKGIHQERHYFASKLLQCGVNIKVISDILGHENVNFTYNRYVHTVNEQKINAVQLLDNIHGKNKYWVNSGTNEWGFVETHDLQQFA
jgi:integrase